MTHATPPETAPSLPGRARRGTRSRRSSVLAALVAATAMALPAATLVPASAGPVTSPAVTGEGAATSYEAARRPGMRVQAPATVEPGSTFRIRGKVRAGRGKRVVTLAEKRGRKWKKVAKARTSRKGAFSLRVKAGSSERTRSFRVQASRRGTVLARARTRVRVVVPAPPAPPRSATSVTASWSTLSAPLDSPVTVTGQVSAPDAAGRPVVLQHELPGGWRDVAAGTVAADGTYALSQPSDWLYSTPMRVVVPMSHLSDEGASVPTVVTTVPTWTPPGAPADWKELSTSRPLRYDPCKVVNYRTNLSLTTPPAGADQAIVEALRRISQTTGLRFRHLGSTTAVFDGKGAQAAYPADTSLIIGFATAAHTNAPFGDGGTIGWGGSMGSTSARSPALGPVWSITKGGAVLKGDFAWTYDAMLEALMHEVGHAVGLGHAAGTDQVMYPVSEGANMIWGAGDLSGLRSAGLQSGCHVAGGTRAADATQKVVALP